MEKMSILENYGGDIREYKKALRSKHKEYRANMPADIKAEKDRKIFEKIISSSAYAKADIILTYVSTAIEVDTWQLIGQALKDKKRVAVPRCIDGTRDMDFYFITGKECLDKGTFGVLEPVPSKCVKAYAFETALCIIPGLSFDMQGYRLGYGGGYYDRFLSAHSRLVKMGICYCACTCSELIHGRYDVKADMIVTEKFIRRLSLNENYEERNGKYGR